MIYSDSRRETEIDFLDYLKTLLVNEGSRHNVLFCSEFLGAERQPLTKKKIPISQRSILGEEQYSQISQHNPKPYLGVQ